MKRYSRFIGFGILILVLVKLDLQIFFTLLTEINPLTFFLINLLLLPCLFIKSYRWKYLLQLQGIEYSTKDSIVSYLRGISLGIITPGRVGELVKAIYLKEDKNVPLSEAMASVFLDRLFDLYMLILLGWIGFCYYFNLNEINFGIMIFISLFLFAVPFLLFNKLLLENITKSIYRSLILKLDKKFFEEQFKMFFSSMKKIILAGISFPVFLTVLVYLLYFWQCFLLAQLVSINIPYWVVVFFIAVSNLMSMLPITILGLGTREACLIYLFSQFGISAESAVVFSFILFVSFYIGTGLISYCGWSLNRKNQKA